MNYKVRVNNKEDSKQVLEIFRNIVSRNSKQPKELKVKEYLVKNKHDEYVILSDVTTIPSEFVIEVPEGADELLPFSGDNTLEFYRNNRSEFFNIFRQEWGTAISDHSDKIPVWQRQPKDDPENNPTDLEVVASYFIKYLKCIPVQYKCDNKEGSQWHNMTDNSMKYFKHPNIQLREAPKYVTINGVEFKTKEALMKYVDKNYTLDS